MVQICVVQSTAFKVASDLMNYKLYREFVEA